MWLFIILLVIGVCFWVYYVTVKMSEEEDDF